MIDHGRLDRYMRHRYGPRKATARSAAKALLPIRLLARRQVAPCPCDVLLLQPHGPAAQRHARLRDALESTGLSTREAFVSGTLPMLARREFLVPQAGWSRGPRHWRLQAAYAAWLVARHEPRVVLTFMDDTFLTPFLHRETAARGAILANVAHTIVFPNIDFSMCDVDWLMLFGERSLENLRTMPLRYGDCRVVVTGSPYLGAPAGAPVAGEPAEPLRLLWLGQYAHPSQRDALARDMRSLARFIVSNPGWPVAIRPHPLDRGETRRLLGPIAERVRWLESTGLIRDVMGEFDVAIASFSAGLVDAAACGTPVIAFATSGLAEYLGFPHGLLALVRDHDELRSALDRIAASYDRARGDALSLARAHYHLLDDGVERISRVVATLARGGDVASLGLPTTHMRSAGL